MVGADAGAHVLRILLLGGGREADQVAEENGYDLPLLEHGRRLIGKRRRAEPAKREPVRVLFAAARADHHTPSLGHECREARCPTGGFSRAGAWPVAPPQSSPNILSPNRPRRRPQPTAPVAHFAAESPPNDR